MRVEGADRRCFVEVEFLVFGWKMDWGLGCHAGYCEFRIIGCSGCDWLQGFRGCWVCTGGVGFLLVLELIDGTTGTGEEFWIGGASLPECFVLASTVGTLGFVRGWLGAVSRRVAGPQRMQLNALSLVLTYGCALV